MPWMLIPAESCRCAPAPAGSISGCGSPSRAREPFATSSATPMHCECSALACGMGGSTAPQSGTTLSLLTLERGPERWISSWRGSHANPSAPPGAAPAPGMSGGFGTTLHDATPTAVRAGSQWRTFAGSCHSGSTEYSARWPSSGALRSGCAYARPRWEPRIDASGGSAWPTAAATDHKGAPEPHQRRGQLAPAAEHWPTPDAATLNDGESPESWDARRQTMKAKGYNRNGAGKVLAVEAQRCMWPTARATDGTKGSPNQRGSSGDLMLPSAVAQRATPTAGDAKGSGSRTLATSNAHPGLSLTDMAERGRLDLRSTTSGAQSSPAIRRLRLPLRLNARFAEWLMGWPVGWTSVAPLGSECAVTGWSRHRPGQRSPSYSGDCTAGA